MSRNRSGFWGRKNVKGIAITVVIALSLFVPTPYYLYQPGTAEPLQPKVTVEKGDKDEQGNLMLLTVLSIKANNIYYLLYGLVAPHTEMKKEEDVRGDLTDYEYDKLLKHMMDSSQQNAMVSGMKAAGEKVDIDYKGVFVRSVLDDSKAKGVLMIGDVITAVDGHPVHRSEELIDYLNANKKPGDNVTLSYLHDDLQKTATIELKELEVGGQKEPGTPKHVGIGVVPENILDLHLPRKVTIHAEDIGGPSAGMMFALEIYSQITPGDLTKGYHIAGTGTINLDAQVGQIGGIRHKVVAAHDEGAEIFFAPADVNENDSNAHDAADEVKKLGYTDMKVVPVKTLQDAIDYLHNLPPKKS
ncbi:MAG TPA: SepM family pheromone-processing serine protease [Bacilli bacterium]|nr:SepM family pheromone-processing serine protease [Bacilli bacterium]